jgi:hypothetical protein
MSVKNKVSKYYGNKTNVFQYVTIKMSICESCYLMREYIEMKDYDRMGLLYGAIRFHHINCLEHLLSQYNPDVYELRGLIYFSMDNGYLTSWKILVNRIPKNWIYDGNWIYEEHFIFEMSLEYKQFDCSKYLLQQGYRPIPATISMMICVNIDDPFWRTYLFQLVDSCDSIRNKDIIQWILAKRQEIQEAKDTLFQLYLENKLSKDVMIYMIYPYL